MNPRKPFSKGTRMLVLSRDDNKCRACGRSAEEVSLEVDHIFPRSQGGTDDLDNLVSLCKDCNLGKSDLLLRSMLKLKVSGNDFTPIQKPTLKVSCDLMNTGERRLHTYQLSVIIANKTAKTISKPQLEVILPSASLQTLSSRAQKTTEGYMDKIFFPTLDVEIVHPGATLKLMPTSNVGVLYKMGSDIHDDNKIMKSDFTITLFSENLEPVSVKKTFLEMQCF